MFFNRHRKVAQLEGKVMDSLERAMQDAEAVAYLAPKCTRCGKGAADGIGGAGIEKDEEGVPTCTTCWWERLPNQPGLPGLVEAYNRCRKAT